MPPPGRHWRSDVTILEQLDKDGFIEWSDNGNTRKKIYFDEQEGKRMQDIWEFKDPQYPVYPTEKNPDLLDIIVKTSSRENSIVLDCFAGSGTTLKLHKPMADNGLVLTNQTKQLKQSRQNLTLLKTTCLFQNLTTNY